MSGTRHHITCLFNASSTLTATVHVNAAPETGSMLLIQYSLTVDDGEDAANVTRLLGDPAMPGIRRRVAR